MDQLAGDAGIAKKLQQNLGFRSPRAGTAAYRHAYFSQQPARAGTGNEAIKWRGLQKAKTPRGARGDVMSAPR
jgi:hypothetical protein